MTTKVPYIPENYVDQVGPDVSAAWLNGVDATVFGVLLGATTVADVQNILQITNNQGPPGPAGPPGPTGPAGIPGLTGVVLSAVPPSIVVPADSSGNVSSFATAIGQCYLYNGGTDVTASASFSLTNQTNCTATCSVGGAFAFSAMSATSGTITIQATYQGNTFTTQVVITKAIAGAAGGSSGVSLVMSNPVATVLAYANGTVPSFAGINGICHLYSGGTDVSSSATWSASGAGLTGTVNTANNTPVNGQPIGYYQVTAMTQTVATLTISAVYLATTYTAVFVVTQVPTGYQIVATLPNSGPALFEGNVVYLTTDGQLYRYHSGAWIVAVPAVNITGTITTTQIADGAISTPKLAANSVTAANIAANAVTAGSIAANAVTANAIAAGQVTAAKIGVTQLSAISANLGTVTAGRVQNASGSVVLACTDANVPSGYIEFNNGTYMKVSGVNFGANSNYLEWYGPTKPTTGNFAACTDAAAIYYIKNNGACYFGGGIGIGVAISGNSGKIVLPPNAAGQAIQFAWGRFNSSGDPTTGTFTYPFATTCQFVSLTTYPGSASNWPAPQVLAFTKTTCTFASGGQIVGYLAIGY